MNKKILLCLSLVSVISFDGLMAQRSRLRSSIRTAGVVPVVASVIPGQPGSYEGSEFEDNMRTFPQSGDFFKTSAFTFKEGKVYKLSEFIKPGISVAVVLSTCGVVFSYYNPNLGSQLVKGELEPHFGSDFFVSSLVGKDMYDSKNLSITQADLEESYVIYSVGSGEKCIGNNIIFLEDSNGKKDRMDVKFTVSGEGGGSDGDGEGEVDPNIVSEEVFQEIMAAKGECSKISSSTLNEMKGWLTSASVTSGIGTGGNIAATVTSGLAGSEFIKGENLKKAKNLSLATSITGGISTGLMGFSSVATGISGNQLNSVVKGIKQCKERVDRISSEHQQITNAKNKCSVSSEKLNDLMLLSVPLAGFSAAASGLGTLVSVGTGVAIDEAISVTPKAPSMKKSLVGAGKDSRAAEIAYDEDIVEYEEKSRALEVLPEPPVFPGRGNVAELAVYEKDRAAYDEAIIAYRKKNAAQRNYISIHAGTVSLGIASALGAGAMGTSIAANFKMDDFIDEVKECRDAVAGITLTTE